MKYTRIRQAIADAERQNGLHELDSMMRDILHTIARAHLNNERLRVTHLTKRSEYGTFPTLQKKLAKLLDGGWIERRSDDADKRSILLQVTPKTLTTFEMTSELLEAY